MNIGARIQSLRKAQEMSQEDLASLLSVSRQTVSQWETDQTVPSLDNIYRLKEIFGVSFDGLLSEKEETQPAAGEYKEEFSVTYSPEDIKKANRLIYSKNIKVAIISLFVYYFLLNFLITAEAPDALPGMVCGILFVSVIRWIVQLINVKKAQKRSIMQTSRKIYGYTVTRNVLTVSVSENRELNSQYRIKKGDISLVWENKKYIVFAYSGQLFILNKEKVPQSILLGEFLYSAKKINTASTRDKTVSNILVALSVLSLFFALYASIGGVAERNLDMQRYGLSFFLFAPLPIASIIFGYSQRRKGIPNKKNIVVGIIMTVLLCIYGSLFFVVSDMISYDYAVIEQYEAELGIDLPESGMATIQDFSDTVKEENSNEFIYSMCQVEYSADEAAELRRNILKDDRWLKKVPAEILGCTPFGTYTGYDHFLLYNADLKQFNSLPRKAEHTGLYS